MPREGKLFSTIGQLQFKSAVVRTGFSFRVFSIFIYLFPSLINFLLRTYQNMSSCTVPTAPAPPSLKDLPKVAGDLKSELEGFSSSKLKNAETQEKIVLPSAEDVAAEKTEKALIEGIAKFNPAKLKHTETQEKNPLPDKEVVLQERCHQNLLNGVEHFDKTTMKHAETSEKCVLPDTKVIEQEKAQSNLLSGIANFDSTKLKHAETQEKNPLPTKETIDQEKSA
ncbi:hypothetical protein ABEB36_006296 [Hypothenemus hampei]|uniref:Thymosin beta n=1 Tax=Hypothenemus hampei TaxID=57062 RepID=A0ABD1EU08_HYPHA